MTVYEVLACAAENDLTGDRDLSIVFEANGALLFVAVVEDDCDASFCDACLPALVDEVLIENSQLAKTHILGASCRDAPEGSELAQCSCW
jgi:hypothetical protein